MDRSPITEKRRILLVDDEQKFVFGLKKVLELEGFEVSTATNGVDGLKLVKTSNPDLILCDIMMPGMNGFQLKTILAGDPLTADIPFIFITARSADVDRIAGLKQGADDYVVKPFNVTELIARVHAVMRREAIGRQKGASDLEKTVDSVKRKIDSNLAHEFRAPVAVIMASLDLAIREKRKGETGYLDWYLNTCMLNAQKLSRLVCDLILLHDIHEGTVNSQRMLIDLEYYFVNPIRQVLRNYGEKNLNVQVQMEPGVVVYAPEMEFAHAVSHLVDNACKFSPANGTLRIVLRKNGQGGCLLVVADQGPGIPRELREKVFECYYQGETEASVPAGGLGVGLTIAREVAEACGGSLFILDPPSGCEVRMVLPPVGDEVPVELLEGGGVKHTSILA